MKVVNILALSLILTLLTTYSGSAQQQQQKQSSQNQGDQPLRIETEVVQIDVVVTDKQGNIVRDLKREDFQLFEDGKPQTIAYFSVNSVTNPARWIKTDSTSAKAKNPTTPSPVALENTIGRHIVLAIDDIHLAPGNLMFARQALLKFFDKQVTTGDQVALITTSGQLGLYQQFTTDYEALRRAINRLSVQERTITSSSDVPRITPYQAELIDNYDPDATQIAVNELMTKLRMSRDMALSEVRIKARMINAMSVNFTTQTLATLENVIRGLRPLPGRKAMVLLSDGFTLGGSSQGRFQDLRRITDAATRAGVVIYSIDARGLVTGPASMDASQSGFGFEIPPGARQRIENSSIEAQRDGLNALAHDTGGFPVFNTNDLNLGFQRVLDDTESYYLLGFEPTSSYRDGRYRKLQVKIPGRPELKIRTRSGYLAPDDKAAAKAAKAKAKAEEKPLSQEKADKQAAEARIRRMTEAFSSLYPLRGIPTDMHLGFLYVPTNGTVAVINARIDAANLNFKQVKDRHQTMIEIAALVFDEKGKPAGSFSEAAQMNLRDSTLNYIQQNGLSYRKIVPLKPGLYQIRLAVREEGSANLGSAYGWVEVADLNQKQFSLSSIFITNPERDATAKEGQIDQNEDTSKNLSMAFLSSLHFKKEDKFDFAIVAYNPQENEQGATDVAIQTQVRAGNKILMATPLTKIQDTNKESLSANDNNSASKPVRSVPYLARLSLNQFNPGNYELRVVVVDRLAKTTASRNINFVID